MKGKLRYLIIAFLCGVFFFSAGKIVAICVEQEKESNAFELLAQEIAAVQETTNWSLQEENTNDEFASVKEEVILESEAKQEIVKAERKERTVMKTDEQTGMLVPYQSMYEKNNDLYGWIVIEGTKVNYPVMCTPDDPEYYLHRDFYKADAKSGCPFLDVACSEEGNLDVVYGHKMKNGTMFAPLIHYQKKDYWKQHPYIYFDTLYQQGTYEVVAAFYSKIYKEGEAGFPYYHYKDLREEETFWEFAKGVEASALYETDEALAFGDKVLLLSTCSYHTEEGRFVVVAKKII